MPRFVVVTLNFIFCFCGSLVLQKLHSTPDLSTTPCATIIQIGGTPDVRAAEEAIIYCRNAEFVYLMSISFSPIFLADREARDELGVTNRFDSCLVKATNGISGSERAEVYIVISLHSQPCASLVNVGRPAERPLNCRSE